MLPEWVGVLQQLKLQLEKDKEENENASKTRMEKSYL